MNSERTSASRIRIGNVVFWASIVALILASYWWRINVLKRFPFSYDEGIHLVLGKLYAAGFRPYEEIFVSYPPAFLWSVGIPWKLFGQANALQLLMATYALVGVLSVIYLGTVYNSRLAGVAAGVFLSFTPAYFIPSFSIMTEIPSISFAVAAVALAEKYRRSGGWVWALATGMALAYGLSLKILPYYAVPLVAAMVASRHLASDLGSGFSNRQGASIQRLTRDSAVLLGGILAIFLIPLALFNVEALYDQVVGMRLVSREVELNPFESNSDMIIEFLFGTPGLLALALYGLIFVVAQKLRHYWIMALWIILIWISLYFLVPLRDKHLPIFLPIVGLYAGFAVNHIYHFLGQVTDQPVTLRTVSMGLTILLVLGSVLWNVPRATAENNGQILDISENEERQAAIRFIDEIATPDDCVIADNPVFLYQTQRLPPPELSETSQTRVDTGFLTLSDVVESIQTYRCHVVAVVTPRFGESIPGLPEWLAQNYLALYAQSETFVYFAPKGSMAPAENAADKFEPDFVPVADGDFGGLVRLAGFSRSEDSLHPNRSTYISLWWRLQSALTEEYGVNFSMRNLATGERAYEFKRLPFAGHFDPATWPVDELARDTFRIQLPDNLARGTYELILSLCRPDDSEQCLAINGRAQSELSLGQIRLD